MIGGSAVPVQAQSMMKDDMMMAPAGATAKHSFRKAEAPVSGSFMVKKEGGKQLLVLSSDFKTNDMAPDLKVIFSPSATPLASTKAPGYPLKAGTYTILASLKSAAGAQSYVIPASIDLGKQGSVLIWCKKFNATMAWAPLKP
ncbi:DM13 domain-containing protein [Synechococcus sp. CS-1324]|nr:DM13 domain-containing protein [Synechococcus sp. CS-1324]